MANTRFVLLVCSLVLLTWPAEGTISFRRKPILNYLIRYKLGMLKSKGLPYGGLTGFGGFGGPPHHPHEEHIHHYYVHPAPIGPHHVHAPIVHGHQAKFGGFSQFSLQTPLIEGELKYNHLWGPFPHNYY